MPLPRARTRNEAHLYMSLVPCPCGESDFDRDVDVLSVTPRVLHFFGRCVQCGRSREFTFEIAQPPGPDVGGAALDDGGPGLGYGDAPSTLIDAGQWMVVALVFFEDVRAAREAGRLAADQIPAVYELLRTAAACVDEILKFIPAGADRVPDEGFWSGRGMAVRHAMPEAFERDPLLAVRAEWWGAVTDFEDEYDIDELDIEEEEDRDGVAR